MRCHDTGVGFYTSVSLILLCDALKYITHTFVRWVDWLPFALSRFVVLVCAYGLSESNPRLWTCTTAWTRLFTPSFEKILLTWRLTVSIESTSVSAIS